MGDNIFSCLFTFIYSFCQAKSHLSPNIHPYVFHPSYFRTAPGEHVRVAIDNPVTSKNARPNTGKAPIPDGERLKLVNFVNNVPKVGFLIILIWGVKFIFTPMDANFICDEAMKKGVILRPTNPFGLPDNIRITIAREEENERVVEVIREIISK